MKKITIFFALCTLFSLQLFAQGEEEYCYLTIELKSGNEEMSMARYFEQARREIKVEFAEYIYRAGQSDFGKRYEAVYNDEKDAWTIRLPAGLYQMRTQHIGFKPITELVETGAKELAIQKKLSVDSLPYTYENGQAYNYIKGGMQFSETLIVYFRAGEPDENKAYLEETFAPEKVQKIKYSNAFFLTLNLKSQVTLAEILYRQTLGDDLLPEGYYFGDAVTKAIETLQYNENVRYANPTFILDKEAAEVLQKGDFSTVNGLLSALKDRRPDEPKNLNPNDFEKSDGLKQKLLRKLEEE